jgi:hypothetical protein
VTFVYVLLLGSSSFRPFVLAQCKHGEAVNHSRVKNDMIVSSNADNPRGRTLAPQNHVWAELGTEYKPFKIERETGAGRGKGGAVWVREALDKLSIGAALSSVAMPCGYLLHEAQGQQVLDMARKQAAKLRQSMRRDGRNMSDTTEQEAIAAGAGAVVRWRNGEDCDGAEHGAAGVCWRAIVQSVAQDSFGESIEDWRGQDDDGADTFDTLTGSALPLPSLVGDGSRNERASRLLFERARAKRGDLLARRIESLKANGGRGKRAELIDKIHRAAILLLHGETVDNAATGAGFKGSERHRVGAGDRLMRAVRRLGFCVQFNLRQVETKERANHGGACQPITAATFSGWTFNPSETLPCQDGRGGKRLIPKLKRMQRAKARRARLATARLSRAMRLDKRDHKRATLARAARREDKTRGLWAQYGAVAGAPVSRTNGYWRGAARLWQG